MSPLLDCPRTESWRALLASATSPDDQERYERHLESCPACRDRLERLVPFGDGLLRLARQTGDPTAVTADPVLAQVMDRLLEVNSPDQPSPPKAAELYFLAPADRPGLLGTLGGYEVEGVIGQGGMGVVLKAFEPALHRPVAIKVLAAALAGSATARLRFEREGRAAAAVCHDNVVAVHGVGDANGLPYLVMQYVAGESLQDRLNQCGPLELEEVVRIGMQTAAGLAAAHAQGLIHRDIKPANLLLENGVARVKITDFGLARTADDAGLTRDGVVAGTPEYMAPEQARSAPVDHRADLYSLGAVLYACCTGKPPFRGSTALAVLRQVNDEEPPPLRTRISAVPRWLETLVARLMAKDPADRIQSAAEVAALLEGYLAHLRQPATVPAPPLPPKPGGRSGKSKARGWSAVAGWLLALVLVGTGLLAARALLLQAVPPAAAGPPAPVEFYQDFRGGQTPAPPLYLAGPDVTTLTRPEAGGFRVTLPRDRQHREGRVGLEMTTRIQGDFEITAGYEILQVEQPVKGPHGVAFALVVETDTPRHDVVELARATRVGEGEVYNCARITDGDDGKRKYQHAFPPASGERGRLRLARVGREAILSAAEGDDGEFQELTRYDLGPEDVIEVSAAGFTGYAPNQLDLRILDFRLRNTPGVAAGGPASGEPAKAHSRPWLTAAGLIGLLVLLTALGVWLVAARRRRAEDKGRPATEAPTPAAPAAPVARRLPSRRWLLLLAPAALAAGLLLLAFVSQDTTPPRRPDGAAPAMPAEFRQDFRTADYDRDVLLSKLGPDVVRDGNGLQIKLEAGPDHDHQTGLDTAFPVRGDFEITASYNVLSADRPEKGYGVGVGLYAPIDPDTQDAVSLARRLQPDGRVQFVSTRMTPGDGKINFQVRTIPSTSATGKLRLERNGRMLTTLVADGADAPFVVLGRVDLGTADLRYVRLEGNTGQSDAGLDARILDFSVRAGELPGAPDAGPAPPGSLPGVGWLAAAAVVGLLTAVALVGGWLLSRRRRFPAAPVPDTVVRPRAPAPLLLACPGCGHGLKVKPELAGKKGKCPKCGGLVLVPRPTEAIRPGGTPG